MSKAKTYYEDDFLEKQLRYYRSVPEKQRRHFLALEFERLGEGSKHYLARVFGFGRQTIRKGLRELAESSYEADYTRQRVEGDVKKEAELAELTIWILDYVKQHTAGSPTDENVLWTHLRHCDIAEHLQKSYQVKIETDCIERILYLNRYRKRKPQKKIATGTSPCRSEQFRVLLSNILS